MDDPENVDSETKATGSVSPLGTQELVQQALDWAYERAIGGAGVFVSADALAEEYRAKYDSALVAVDALIRWQVAKASAIGFATGVPGGWALPATIPVNLAGVFTLQLRMIAAIARIGGNDVASDHVKTAAFVCLCGQGATEALKEAGVKTAQAFTKKAISQIPGNVLVQVNRAVGFRLVTKAGQTGVVNLSKLLPVVGGIVGGTFDASTTYAIGQTAKKLFVELEVQEEEHLSASPPG